MDNQKTIKYEDGIVEILKQAICFTRHFFNR